jgi:hypothetical protein
MSVEEIEHAIRALSANEFALIAERVHAGSAWDAELDRDAGSGKLDFLIVGSKRGSCGRSSHGLACRCFTRFPDSAILNTLNS